MSDVPLVTIDDVRAAAQRIAPYVRRTPTNTATSLGELCGSPKLHLKAELFQRTGSFKFRGVVNTLLQLSADEVARGVCAMSAGNHAAALALGARELGTTAVIVMPAHASVSKVDLTRAYGGEVVLVDGPLWPVVQALQADRGLVLVHPFDDPRVLAGAGTVGLELIEDVPDVDVVVVPIGGGGLASGIGVVMRALKPDVRLIGVEPRGADGMSLGLAAGEVITIDRPTSLADGLCAPFAGRHTLAHVAAHFDEVVVIDDEDIAAATRHVHQRAKLAVEPAAAAAVAALMTGGLTTPDQVVACVMTGGNVDAAVIAKVFASSGS
ncbi:MAG TPA: pyridoxal-phosphate dependent enzyme [Mycobacteriales bacterium]|nr:pyridoxal-phosphate dependent enzyme [Mycobacteriales bacterium]